MYTHVSVWFCTRKWGCPLRLEEMGPLEHPHRVAGTWIRVLGRSRTHLSSHFLLLLLPFLSSLIAFAHYHLRFLFPPSPASLRSSHLLSAPRDLPLGRSWILRPGLGSLVLGLEICPFALTPYHLKSPLPDCSFQTSQPHFPVDYLGGLLNICLSFVSSYVNAEDTHTCSCPQRVLTLCNWFGGMPSFLLRCTPSVVFAVINLSWPVWF